MMHAYEPEVWRRPGCDQRCQIRTVIAVGLLRRIAEPVHDPDAHEEYGLHLAARPGLEVIRTGPLVVDLGGRTVTVGTRDVEMTPREWTVLALLATAKGGILSLAELSYALWPEDNHADPAPTTKHATRVWIARLRGKLNEAEALIETCIGRGYRLRMIPPSTSMPLLPRKRWSMHYDACTRCGTTDSRHEAHGYCAPCVTARRAERRNISGAPRPARRRPYIPTGNSPTGNSQTTPLGAFR